MGIEEARAHLRTVPPDDELRVKRAELGDKITSDLRQAAAREEKGDPDRAEMHKAQAELHKKEFLALGPTVAEQMAAHAGREERHRMLTCLGEESKRIDIDIFSHPRAQHDVEVVVNETNLDDEAGYVLFPIQKEAFGEIEPIAPGQVRVLAINNENEARVRQLRDFVRSKNLTGHELLKATVDKARKMGLLADAQDAIQYPQEERKPRAKIYEDGKTFAEYEKWAERNIKHRF
jgi:hypothetical protein